jgi:hypothetical protein
MCAGLPRITHHIERTMSMSTIQHPLIILLVGLSIACASAGTAPDGAAPGRNRSVITVAEIPTSGSESAYDLIQRLRPEYLRIKPAQGGSLGSGVGDAPPPVVVTNGQRSGELSDLRRIPASSLAFVHYFNIEEAKRKFGMQYAGGAIEIGYRQR